MTLVAEPPSMPRAHPGERRSWAIVGGGLLGLTLALRLAQRGQHVVVHEAAPEVGGLASAWQVGDATWDRFYHVTLSSDRHTRRLLAELGLEDEVHWDVTRTGCFAGGRLHPLTSPVDWLRFPALSTMDKARLVATIGWGTVTGGWRRLERTPVETWLRRWSGDETFERFWLPLLKAKLGDLWPQASAAFIWATIQRLSSARRQGMVERFG